MADAETNKTPTDTVKSVKVKVKIPVSVGELVDKITILQIKCSKLTATIPEHGINWRNVNHELSLLYAVLADVEGDMGESQAAQIAPLTRGLQEVNKRLWDVEDELRKMDEKVFPVPRLWAADKDTLTFLRLARSVYKFNDERSDIKRQLNELAGSDIVEVKLY